MTPAQPRGATRLETRTRILDAAARLLRDSGTAAVTTRAVAAAAGVQAPAIYRLFGDKDGLLDAVAEREAARYVDVKAAEPVTDDPVADLRAAWDRNIGFGLANPTLFTLLIDPERLARSPVIGAGNDLLRARVRRVAQAGRLRVSERRAVDLIRAAGVGAVLALLGAPAEDRDPGLADDLYEAVSRTVLSDPAQRDPEPATDQVASAAVTLRAAASELPGLSEGERALLGEWLDRLAGS